MITEKQAREIARNTFTEAPLSDWTYLTNGRYVFEYEDHVSFSGPLVINADTGEPETFGSIYHYWPEWLKNIPED
ncbi:PepSY domain-containing protein [Corynebacterium hindlerae]|uniref:PepSY domain-containing protein n=1 Tax=Corynebacterium hindlerae TaxID=699041 RepID=UPI001AD6E28D|nr:PepSY domain-containing protein [Corynebacterium hindlerae]QTH59349.1 PepSY domain-containing protein [Corynebacterium hindlerae]